MVEDDWGAWQMLVFNSPKPDILFPARNQLIGVDWTEFQSGDAKITDLLAQQYWFPSCLNFADVKYQDDLSFVLV